MARWLSWLETPPCHGGGRGFEPHPGRFLNIFYFIFVQIEVEKLGYNNSLWLIINKNKMKFMKKTVFCVALVAALFLAVPANAQFKFGPKVGMNISTLSLSGNLSDNFKANNISSFTGGLMAEFMVPVIGIGVDASLMYTRKGSELKDITSGISESKHVDYVEIPINLKYKFSLPVVGSILSPFVYAGPSFAFRVGDNFKEQFKEKSFDTAINVGLGLELFNHLQIAGQYGWGLGSAMEVKNDLPDSVMKGKSRAWTITAAYLF